MAEAKELTQTILKGLLTDMFWHRGTCADMNVVNQTGIFIIDQAVTANIPTGAYGYGIMIQWYLGSWMWMQVYFTHHNDLLARIRLNNQTGVWRRFTPAAII